MSTFRSRSRRASGRRRWDKEVLPATTTSRAATTKSCCCIPTTSSSPHRCRAACAADTGLSELQPQRLNGRRREAGSAWRTPSCMRILKGVVCGAYRRARVRTNPRDPQRPDHHDLDFEVGCRVRYP
eukprot:48584-Prymnesium_polylepis.1